MGFDHKKEIKESRVMSMQIGMVGLGKMGGNMTSRLLQGGHGVVVFDRNKDAIIKAE